MIKHLVNNLKNPTYYFSQIFGAFAYLFLIVLWIYLKNESNLEVTNTQIINYFLFIYSFNYMFTFSFVDRVVARLEEKSEQFWLNPKNAYLLFLKKDFLPIIIDKIPLIVVTLLIAVCINLLSPKFAALFILLSIISHICHFFLSVTFAILKFYLNWEWVSFSLRFIGLTWNGSYLPIVFIKGIFLKITLVLPFLHSGVPMQLIFDPDIKTAYILNILVYTLIFSILSLILLKNYKRYVQD